MTLAKGSFNVTLAPMSDEGFEMGRMTLDKSYEGDMVGTAKGQMLSHRSETPGSAGYVAMEVVDVTLVGNKGGFVLMHRGVMDKGEPGLLVSVVPDSGTGELVGISGSLNIIIDNDGNHFYELDYSLG